MKTKCLALISMLFLISAVSAQDMARFSEILKSKSVTYGQSAYLAAVYAGAVSEEATDEEAFNALKKSGLIRRAAKINDSITLGDYSYLIMKSLNMSGGLFYTIFDSPRYAVKELKANGVLPPNADPSFTLKGNDAMSILSNCVELVEEN